MNKRNANSPKGTWKGQVSKALRDIYGSQFPPDLFIAKARDLVRDSGIKGPAFDPRFYADFLHIQVSEAPDAPFEGTLRKMENGQFTVLLNESASEERKRFTLAHEIAHTFFYSDLELHRERHSGCAIFDPEEERLCDIGAAELLMPRRYFKADLERLRDENGSVTPQAVLELASLYRVSIQAACVSVARIVSDLTCIYWSKTPSINSDWATPSKFRNLMVCPTGHSSVERAFLAHHFETIIGNDTFYWNCTSLRRETVSLRLGVDTVLSVIQPWSARRRSPDMEREPKKRAEEPRLAVQRTLFA